MRTYRYRITIGGSLGTVFCAAFEDFTIEVSGARTWLIADLDQAALFGALNRIQSVGLELIEVIRIPRDAG